MPTCARLDQDVDKRFVAFSMTDKVLGLWFVLDANWNHYSKAYGL